jgi:hypothetical protein
VQRLALIGLFGCVIRTQAELALTDSADQRLVEVAFEPTAIGQTASLVVRVANVGSAKSAAVGLQILGPNSDIFGMFSECGGRVLEADTACEVTLVFAPTRPGTSTAQLFIAGDPLGIQTIAIVGHAQ